MPSASTDLVRRLDVDPTVPWLTDLDLRTGERSELSVTSAVNAVAKAAHLVASVPTATQQARVEIRLALHWQTVTLLLGCWRAGATVLLGDPTSVDDGHPPDVLVLGPTEAARPPAGPVDLVWASRLHPLGLGFDQPPPFPVEDLSSLLRSQPDQAPPDRGGRLVAAVLDGVEVTFATLTARTQALAEGTGPDGRLLTVAPLSTLDGLVTATTLAGGEGRSVVLVRGAAEDPTRLRDLAAVERVTATVGVDVAGLPRLA